jgi:hypothetical protein
LLSKNKNNLHGAMIFGSDTKDAARGGQVLIGTAEHAGIKSDQTIGISGQAPQSAYTPIINNMKAKGSNYSYNSSALSSVELERSEAQLQGLTGVTWVCTIACYDKKIKDQAAVMEGQYVTMTFLPFEEANSNATLKNFLKYVGPSNADGFAVYGWTATLAFQQAMNAIVKKDGVNGVTRANLLSTGIDALTSFNAGGMIGTVNIKDKVPTACAALVQVKSGNFVRVTPKKKGTFNCNKSNAVQIKANLISG